MSIRKTSMSLKGDSRMYPTLQITHKIGSEMSTIPNIISIPKLDRNSQDDFDPFKERELKNPTSDFSTFVNLLRASIGSGILTVPSMFKTSGLTMGILCMIGVFLISVHCSYILVSCAHTLYKRLFKTVLTFSEVCEFALATGPRWTKHLSIPSKYFVQISIFIMEFGVCCLYVVIMAKNFEEVAQHHLQCKTDIRIAILILLVPLILIAWVPDFKKLAKVSMIANLCMGACIIIAIYDFLKDAPPPDWKYTGSISEFPRFCSIGIFSVMIIDMMMPLENSMKYPKHFLGIYGILNIAMTIMTVIYIVFGVLGFIKYGDKTKSIITSNLPIDKPIFQAVRILLGLTVYSSFVLNFFICLEIVWDSIKKNFSKRPGLANYFVRTVLAILIVLLAVALPVIGPFVGFIGAFCLSILGLILPAFIETITFWSDGLGRFYWMAMKNLFIFIFGSVVLIFGTIESIKDIRDELHKNITTTNISECFRIF